MHTQMWRITQDDYLTEILNIARKEAFRIDKSYKVIVLSALKTNYTT